MDRTTEPEIEIPAQLRRLWGAAIRAARKNRGETQVELSRRLGTDQTTLSGWELGRFEPTLTMRLKIADELEVEVGDLFGYPESLREAVSE